jgi:hypothetical protein
LHDASEYDLIDRLDRILRFYSWDCSCIVLCDECVHYSSDERARAFALGTEGTYWVRTGGEERDWVEIMELHADKEPCPCQCNAETQVRLSPRDITVRYFIGGEALRKDSGERRMMKVERPARSGAEELENLRGRDY